MMRILLFLATNLAVVLIASITLSLFGFDGFMAANGVYKVLLQAIQPSDYFKLCPTDRF